MKNYYFFGTYVLFQNEGQSKFSVCIMQYSGNPT